MYSQQLEFLRDIVASKRTVTSLEQTNMDFTSDQEREEEHESNDEEDVTQEFTSESSTHSSARNISRTKVGKKRLHPVEDKILQSLDRYEKKSKIDKAKETVEDDNNRLFLLSLVQSLAALPQHLNTRCRIEIMQCINKYETMDQHQNQPPSQYLSTIRSYPSYQQYNQQSQQLPHFQPIHHTQMYIPSQLQSQHSQHQPTTSVTPMPTPSPAESAASYISSFVGENDLSL